MSELQLGLIAIGILVVACVWLFNWYQERQFQRRVERAFKERPADVLMSGASVASQDAASQSMIADTASVERTEPRLLDEPASDPGDAATRGSDDGDVAQAQAPAAQIANAHPAPASTVPLPPVPPADIEFECIIEGSGPISIQALHDLLQSAVAIGKPVNCAVRSDERTQWFEFPGPVAADVSQVRLALQLADRSGAANRVQLASFRDLVVSFADRQGGRAKCPEIDMAALKAVELDKACAEFDVSIGLNIVAQGTAGFAGTKLRGMAEAAGFKLEADGRFLFRSDQKQVLFGLDDMSGKPFQAERMREMVTQGVSIVMDVARVSDGLRVFDRMVEVARQLANGLNGTLVDDRRAALSDAGVDAIRTRLRAIYAAMEARGISPGSDLALRLFC